LISPQHTVLQPIKSQRKLFPYFRICK